MKLDIGCGERKEEGWLGMDVQKLPGVDMVHDLTHMPWPVGDESCSEIRAWHVLEHIPRAGNDWSDTQWTFIDVMNECWRVMQVGGRMDIEMPYGSSPGFLSDPTHVNPCNEVTWRYFDPECEEFRWYKPKPWMMKSVQWTADGNMNVVMEKRSLNR